MNFIAYFLIFAVPLFNSSAFAQSTYLSVGNAKTKKPVIALIETNAASNALALSAQIQKTIDNDLNFIELFKMLPSAGFAQTKINAAADVKYPEWIKSGADFVVYSSTKLEKSGLIFELHVAGMGKNQEVLAKRYTAETSDAKTLAHSAANDIVQLITGKKGIFLTKILFACDKTGKKEIYTMNFDGSDIRQITKIKSITMAPAWNSNGTKIAFSVFNKHSDNNKNLDLFQYDFASGKLELLSNKKGINSGAAYHPDGKRLALTLSFNGNPDIYFLDIASRVATPFTKSIGFDVDPAFSPDGSKIAFVSSRAGKPMVYVAPVLNAADAKRLTYAGSYNATPSWSPDAKKLVFAGWIDGRFDLFTINVDSMQIDRLTKNEGNNEDPSYSPDGNFITFSSNRSNGKNIWVMSADGNSAKRLTFGMGSCVSPKWSPYLN